MLWRCRWRYRLLTLFKLALFWGIVLAVTATFYVELVIDAGTPLLLAYAFMWSFRHRNLRE